MALAGFVASLIFLLLSGMMRYWLKVRAKSHEVLESLEVLKRPFRKSLHSQTVCF